MPAAPQPPLSQKLSERERPSKRRIYKLEAAGILIISMVVLLLILIRFGHHIAWGAR